MAARGTEGFQLCPGGFGIVMPFPMDSGIGACGRESVSVLRRHCAGAAGSPEL